jgi:soluble lytic murein transglycosylase
MIKKPVVLWILLLIFFTSCAYPAPGQGNNSPSPTNSPVPKPDSTKISSPTSLPSPTAAPIPDEKIAEGNSALFFGEYTQAIQLFQNTSRGSTDPEILAAALYGIARANYLLGNTTTALADFNQVIERYPSLPFSGYSNYFLGQIFTSLKQYDNAVTAYHQFLKLRPGRIDSYIQELLGDILSIEGKYQEAIIAYQAASATPHTGSSETVNLKQASTMASAGDLSSAITMYSAIYQTTTNDYTKAQLDFLIGQVKLSLGQTEAGYLHYQDAVNNFPRSNDS